MYMQLIDAVAYRAELESEKTCAPRSEDLLMGLEIAIADLGDAPAVTTETFEPHPTETIVLRFNFNSNIDKVKEILGNIKLEFPHNTVVAIPDDASLQSCSKDVLENIISSISEIIDRL